MRKQRNVIYNCIYGIYFLLMGFIVWNLIFVDQKNTGLYIYQKILPNWMLLVLGIMVALLYICYRRCRRNKENAGRMSAKSPNTTTKILIILSVILFILQIILLLSIYHPLGEDVWVIRHAADCFLQNTYDWYSDIYFKQNINNVGFYSVTVFFLRIGAQLGFHGYSVMTIMGIILVNLAVLFTGLTLEKMCHNRAITYIAYGTAALLLGLSPWITVVYTDVYSLLWPILSIYVYMKVQQRNYPVILESVLILLIPTLSYHLKPTNLIVGIGIIIMEGIRILREKKAIKALSLFLALLILLGLSSITRQLLWSNVDFQPDKRIQKTAAHYALMGINEKTSGRYNQADDDYTCSFQGTDAKNQADLSLIKQRLKKMGPMGYLSFQSEKMLVDFNNGLFAWGSWNFYSPTRDPWNHGENQRNNQQVEQIADEVLQRYADTPLGELLQNIYYVNGEMVLQKSKSMGQGGAYFPYLVVVEQFL